MFDVEYFLPFRWSGYKDVIAHKAIALSYFRWSGRRNGMDMVLLL